LNYFPTFRIKEKYNGTGIGLAIVKKNSRQSQWSNQSTSAIDHGATFFDIYNSSSGIK
jgi:light-regulated signal transduction histidine kinase (bacteriophytochrome)